MSEAYADQETERAARAPAVNLALREAEKCARARVVVIIGFMGTARGHQQRQLSQDKNGLADLLRDLSLMKVGICKPSIQRLGAKWGLDWHRVAGIYNSRKWRPQIDEAREELAIAAYRAARG